MTAVGVIPARYEASRFPGKPLVEIAGLPMLRRVWEGARAAKILRDVLVATDDPRLLEACEGFGAPVVLTRGEHPTGTDRVDEVALGIDDEIVVNVQGDEPLIEGFVIDAAVEVLSEDPNLSMSTVIHPADDDALDDPNRVKVVLDRSGNALYFSRSRIPALRNPPAPAYWQHVGLYAYRRAFLLSYADLPTSPPESVEKLEQLRALEAGHRLRVAIVEHAPVRIDTPEDYAAFVARTKNLATQH